MFTVRSESGTSFIWTKVRSAPQFGSATRFIFRLSMAVGGAQERNIPIIGLPANSPGDMFALRSLSRPLPREEWQEFPTQTDKNPADSSRATLSPAPVPAPPPAARPEAAADRPPHPPAGPGAPRPPHPPSAPRRALPGGPARRGDGSGTPPEGLGAGAAPPHPRRRRRAQDGDAARLPPQQPVIRKVIQSH